VFKFTGNLDISKSWMNRALIVQSFDEKNISIEGESNSQDVVLLKAALTDLENEKTEFYAGLGGTTFRFLALRVSRQPGNFFIRAEPQLLARPQLEIVHVLKQLGVDAVLESNGLRIKSEGWKEPSKSLIVSTRESSQFLSSVLLSSINLDFDLLVKVDDEVISADYFKYTLQFLETCGLKLIQFENSIFIKKSLKPDVRIVKGEIDISSAFALISAAVIGGKVEINNWNAKSNQPDIHFLELFKKMNIIFKQLGDCFVIEKQIAFQSLSASLASCPDLFPVLSVLCAFAEGESHLFGAPQLKFKESDRIKKTEELLLKCGFQVQAMDDGIKIIGNPDLKYILKKEILFNPEHDHRMAMAAAILKIKGFPVRLSDWTVVNKSYPQFYQHIGLDL
jgi:3-phosphoshikimate 1-carboxyvinyltransferase